MSCIYERGNMLWVAYNDAAGKRVCRSSGFRKGQEKAAQELLDRLAAEAGVASEAAPDATAPQPATIEAAVPQRRSGGPMVPAYGDAWMKTRTHLETANDEAAMLRNHVYPRLGHMAMADVRPRHIRDFVLDLSRAKVRRHGKNGEKNSTIAPRTVRHVYALLHRMFQSAVIDEIITSNPVVVEKNVLPKNVDKDPEWRATAVFERPEVLALISDARLPERRRVLNALKSLAGVRHGEGAGLTWAHYKSNVEPLGKLLIARSYDKERTKTQITREVPVHRTLAAILDSWRAMGWERTFGRAPQPSDLIVPAPDGRLWRAYDADDEFKEDLNILGLRGRRGHDLRRTFITLAQVDGARRDLLKVITHGPAADDIINLYTTFPWPSLCAEVEKLKVDLPGARPEPARVPAPAPAPVDPPDNVVPLFRAAAPKSIDPIEERYSGGCSATCSATCSADFPSTFEPLPRFERGTYGLRNRCSTTEL